MDELSRLQILELGVLTCEDFRVPPDLASVKLACLPPEQPLPCDLYLPMAKDDRKRVVFEKVISSGSMFERRLQDLLLQKGIDEVYCRNDALGALLEFLRERGRGAEQVSPAAVTAKTQLLYNEARSIVERVFRDRPTPIHVGMAKQLVEQVGGHLHEDRVGFQALFSLFSKEYHVFSHCVQVALLGMSFCTFLGWEQGEVTEFGMGALFHDVGKNAIDAKVLNKPCSLTPEEFEAMKGHSLLGFEQLRATRLLSEEQLKIILHHHEAMDGSGYPQGLRGDSIHKYARVARLADCFDALTTKRCYKDALPRGKALTLMRNEMGHTFDPEYLEGFTHFVSPEELSQDQDPGNLLEIPLGSVVQIQLAGTELRLKASLVEVESGSHIVLHVLTALRIDEYVKVLQPVIVRYLRGAKVFGFRATILKEQKGLSPLLFVSCPRKIETLNLRRHDRVDCYVTAEAAFRGKSFQGAIVDVSLGGCRFFMKHSFADPPPALEIGDRITLRGDFLKRRQVIPIDGMVRNINQDLDRSYIGMQFDLEDPLALETIKRFLSRFVALV